MTRRLLALAAAFTIGATIGRHLTREQLVGALEAFGIIDLDVYVDDHPSGSWS